ELGFVPNFYHFVDTVINIKVALKVSKSEDDQYHIQTAPVDAHYASTYNYNLDFAASVQTKIVPIPPPTLMEERLRLMAEMWQRKDDLKIVNGIGAKMEYYLNEAGIKTLKKLSEAKKEDLDNILKKEGLTNPDRYGTANWPEQAELAYQGKWSELRDLQEKSEKDNLKKIPGLGAKSEEVLNTAGIKTYEALSKKSGAALRKILDEAQVSKSIDPSSWPEEAAKLDREKKG
ncbi:MAG: hypothetical protein KDD02_18295, partial [Phaeodactylibacter sp.]|nr:hypothetical protein [Phaeodactylibacter sp.]